MNIKHILTILITFSIYSNIVIKINAKDLDQIGNVYNILEQDPINFIKNSLSKAEMDDLQKKWQKKAVSSIKRPKDAIKNIKKAIKSKIRYYDPSITVERDIANHEGIIFAKKGTKVNPFHHQPNYYPRLIFIDGDDKSQVEFALNFFNKEKNNNHKKTINKSDPKYITKIILVRGDIIKIIKDKNLRIFFDQRGILSNKFSLEYFPSIVKREGHQFKIEEVVLE